MLPRLNRLLKAASLAAIVALSTWVPGAQAQDGYPNRAIELISGFGAGGTTDLVARMTAQYLSEKWGVPINVVNKPGGNTVPAQLEVYNAAADGYTLYADNIGSSSMLQLSVPELPFEVMDRTFVNMISSNSMLIFVHPDSPIETVADIAEEAKKDPAGFTWTGVGVAEIPMRQLLEAAEVDIAETKSVVSKGSVEATTLAAGNNVKVGIAAVGPSISPVQAGLIRPVAITSVDRWPSLPDVPTAIESGYPGVKVVSWIGITGPPNLPSEVVEKWNEGIQDMLAQEQTVEQLTNVASIPDYKGPEAFKQQVAGEVENFQALYNAE